MAQGTLSLLLQLLFPDTTGLKFTKQAAGLGESAGSGVWPPPGQGLRAPSLANGGTDMQVFSLGCVAAGRAFPDSLALQATWRGDSPRFAS